VRPLLADQLQRLGYPGVPPVVIAEIKKYMRSHCMRNLLLARELRHVLRELMTAGIPVIPLKGLALAEALYGDSTLRECADLDLLVPRAQVPDAVRLLETAGYRTEAPWEQWIAAPLHFEIELARPAAGLPYAVDLHWGLLGGDPRYYSAVEECWAAARCATVLGVDAWAMSPEWELLFLALHAARSKWHGLKWLVDIQEICWTWALDWQMVWVIAQRWGWGKILQLTIGACQPLWELPPLPNVHSVSLPSWLPQFPAPPRHSSWLVLRVGCLYFPLWHRRIGYVLRFIGTPTLREHRLLPLPAALFPFYYLLRPLRLAIKLIGRWYLRLAVQWRRA
jgi:hypothetical protein